MILGRLITRLRKTIKALVHRMHVDDVDVDSDDDLREFDPFFRNSRSFQTSS